MNLSVLLAGLVFATLLAGVCLVAILIYFDPTVSGSLVFVLFYLSLLITSTGIFTSISLFIRRISQKRRFPLLPSRAIRQLEVSFRQGLLLAVILVAALILQSQRILAWWHLIILVGLVGLAEWWLARR